MMMWGYGYGGAWWMVLIDVLIPVLVIAVIVAELYSKAILYLTFYQKVATLKAKDPAAEDAAAAPEPK